MFIDLITAKISSALVMFTLNWKSRFATKKERAALQQVKQKKKKKKRSICSLD